MDNNNGNTSLATTRISKRPRCISLGLIGNDGPKECLGLNQLLFRGERNHDDISEACRQDVYTFRLERRTSCNITTLGYPGEEERIVLFRSDRPGAIGKIVYSVTPTSASRSNNAHYNHRRARIHLLEVKVDYRGNDLGGLLFSEAMAALRRRILRDQQDDSDEEGWGDSQHDNSSTITIQQLPTTNFCCDLDVEEDIRRHNKLIHFYQQLGCQLKPNCKISYLNNNDGETYRKIPMQVTVLNDKEYQCRKRRDTNDGIFHSISLMIQQGGFLPVTFLASDGVGRVELPLGTQRKHRSRQVQWLLSENGEGFLQVRTTEGHILVATPNGGCSAVIEFGDDVIPSYISKDWTSFQLLRASDVCCHKKFGVEQGEHDALYNTERPSPDGWMFLSAQGYFLSLTCEGQQSFRCTEDFAVWKLESQRMCFQLDRSNRLHSLQQQYYSKMLTKQTVQYVQEMHARYSGFKLKVMTLWEALNLAQTLPGLPFQVNKSAPSLRTVCFCFAEAARKAGHPDWVQLLALLHKLGSILNCIDAATAQDSRNDFDWTISFHSRVVGCPLPDSSMFKQLQSLNATDELNESSKSLLGMYRLHCGLNNVLLAWTGPEYMFHMLHHNKVGIPEDAFAMLRLFALEDWHSKRLYSHLLNEDDHDVLPFVKDFHELLELARADCAAAKEMSPENCQELWDSHYSHIATKYKVDDAIMW